jgi:hypothetical protein
MKYADVYKGLVLYAHDSSYINEYLRTIHDITAEEILELSVKYLDFDKMYKVTVG